jgi:hypothetical protein
VLERVVPVAAALARIARTFALLAAGAALVIAAYVLRDGLPDGGEETVETVLALVAAAFPPVVLAAFWLVVREVAKLPERLRTLPESGRAQAAELGQIAGEARARGTWLRFPRLLWRFGFLVGSARETLTPWAPLLPLVSLPFLIATAAAFAGAVLEVAVALVLLVALAR